MTDTVTETGSIIRETRLPESFTYYHSSEPSIAEMPYPRVQSHRQLPLEIRARIDDRAVVAVAA